MCVFCFKENDEENSGDEEIEIKEESDSEISLSDDELKRGVYNLYILMEEFTFKN